MAHCSKHAFDRMVLTINEAIPVLDRTRLTLCEVPGGLALAIEIAKLEGTFQGIMNGLLEYIDPPLEIVTT